MSYPEPTRSPKRIKIMELVAKKQMTAAQIGKEIELSRDSAYALLMKMAACNQVRRVKRSNQAFWAKFVPPEKKKREHPIMTGTVRGTLDISYMNTVTRDGAMDAYKIKSMGV